MKKTAFAFLLQLSVATLALILILLGVVQMINLEFPTFTLSIFIVLYVITFLIYLLQARIMMKYPDFSLHVILGGLIVRLLAFAFFNFIMIYSDRDNAVPNVILFFSIYIIYTVVEMIALFRQIRLSKTS